MPNSKTLIKSVSLLFLMQITHAVAVTADTCNACHAPEVRQATQAPQLAGQDPSYLKKQLLHFQAGERGSAAADVYGQQMAAIAKTLSAAEAEQLAMHFSQQPTTATKTAEPTAAQLDQGRRLYIGSCGACHGNKAQGNLQLKAPMLAALESAYLQRQLTQFREGGRGTSTTDKPGRQMAMMSRQLTDSEIQAVAAYIGAGLP
jgi:cytochrome c553